VQCKANSAFDCARFVREKEAGAKSRRSQTLQLVRDIKVGVLPLVHDIFVKADGGSSRVVRGARLAGDRT